MNNDWKDRLNVVYSTNPNFKYETTSKEEVSTLLPQHQKLRVSLDRKNRGVGGAAKDGEIIIQGDFKLRVLDLLKAKGYTQTKPVG